MSQKGYGRQATRYIRERLSFILLAAELCRRNINLELRDPWPRKRPIFAWLYRALRTASAPEWAKECARRIGTREGTRWDGRAAVKNLKALPRSIPQAQRWILFKLHFFQFITPMYFMPNRMLSRSMIVASMMMFHTAKQDEDDRLLLASSTAAIIRLHIRLNI